MRSNGRLSFVVAVCAALAWGGGCSGRVSRGDGESHFLAMCSPDCGAGLECICGVCTKACTAAEACTPLAGAAMCVDHAGCSTPRSCDVVCSSDDDCMKGYGCATGFCRYDMSSASTSGGPPDAGLESGIVGTGGRGTGGARSTGGVASTGGVVSTGGDGGSSSDCTIPLSGFMNARALPYCPPTYSAALAEWRCSFDDHAAFGTCGTRRLFGYGHDGHTTCAYDAVTDALVGARSSIVPGPLSGCINYTAGVLTSTSCSDPMMPPDPNTPPCGSDAGASPSADAGSGTPPLAAITLQTTNAPGKVCTTQNGQLSVPFAQTAGVLDELNCDLSMGCKPDLYVVRDRDPGTTVACSVHANGTNYDVSLSLREEASTSSPLSLSFSAVGVVGPTGGTVSITQTNSVAGGGGAQADCRVTIQPPYGVVKSGAIWASFECPNFLDLVNLGDTGCDMTGIFLFENCSI